jgi:hypothetical protein
MIRTAANDAELAQRMERSFAKRVVLLVVLVAAIGGTCIAKAEAGTDEPRERRTTCLH